LLKYTDKLITADKKLEESASLVYQDKKDLLTSRPETKEVNQAIEALNNFPVGSYNLEDGPKIQAIQNLFDNNALTLRLTALVLTKIVQRDVGTQNEQYRRAMETHIRTLATAVYFLNQHVAFRKNRYKLSERQHIPVQQKQQEQPVQPTPPPATQNPQAAQV
jgi:hypothetical protein